MTSSLNSPTLSLLLLLMLLYVYGGYAFIFEGLWFLGAISELAKYSKDWGGNSVSPKFLKLAPLLEILTDYHPA